MRLRMELRSLMTFALMLLLIVGLSGPVVSSSAETASQPALKYKVGDLAPDFTLRDQNGRDVSLHDFRGKKNVVLAFYVFAFSGG
jgi:cytochrome oxidase Cu insertion factor (SCO1/SenC/PrrC family)